MIITREQFDSFWDKKGRFLKVKNPSRFRTNIAETISSKCHDSADLDDYVLHMRNDRESTRHIVTEFYGYLEKECGYGHIESELYDKHFFDYAFERQLEIAKFLHVPRTAKEIEEEFSIDDRTRRADLQTLEDGITVLGATIKIEKVRENKKYYYRSTLHPVFMPLNLTEVYALTTYLDKVLPKSDMNAEVIRELSRRLKSQLSDYAFKKLYPDETRVSSENAFLDDEEFSNGCGRMMYLLKTAALCRFYWDNREAEGRFEIDDKGKCIIRFLDGSVMDADINDIGYVIIDGYR